MEVLNNIVKKTAKHIDWINGFEMDRRDNISMKITLTICK